MRILITGGAGYIGSHVVRALMSTGHEPIIIDNLDRGHKEAIPKGVKFYNKDISDKNLVQLMKNEQIDGIMHFAAHSQVGESMVNPDIYYLNNVLGSLNLINSAKEAGVKYFVFSSTAATYGEPEVTPITEDMKTEPTNVYGRTKLMIEEILKDYSRAYGMNFIALRYFNAAGAMPTGEIGEDHKCETHLIPLIIQAAMGKRTHINIFGNDYPTLDGTCIRDYIHVNDLASAHILAMQYLLAGGKSDVFNLGTGKGFSVKEIIDTVKSVTGKDFEVRIAERRAGDPAILIASYDKINKALGWEPKCSSVENIVKDAWTWHSTHPNGYKD